MNFDCGEKDRIANTALVSLLKSFYLKNVYHDSENRFGIGAASDLIKVVVRALDSGVNVWNEISEIHKETKSGVVLVDERATQLLIKSLEGKVTYEY
ncbi:hypothetical protein A6E01_19340 (plasmid) [Vibrio breoganii]|uniref:Uncharacterized protein n=1 Tax=Vibrio breoganii TaxID=553239 RepID=A0AAN0XZ76_9VIBR|nr:hypothetical protein [Vibrio breoganii]ANO35370.1 hypothetical protein A6E01_19340 [Vibrio breoganii]PML12708.1 hypothetical protein BCT84_02165 [Vibrio breoganii]